MKTIQVLIKRPGLYPEAVKIDSVDLLTSLQKAVDGYIEVVPMVAGKLVLIVNEEGKLKNLEPNVALVTNNGKVYDICVGTVVVIGDDGEDFRGLTKREMTFAVNWLDVRAVKPVETDNSSSKITYINQYIGTEKGQDNE